MLYELWAGERLVLEKGLPGIESQVAQFQCRVFPMAKALIFGDHDEVIVHFAWWYWQVRSM